MLGVSQSQSFDELNYLLFDYLVKAKGFLLSDDDQNGFKISPAGWAHLDDTERQINSVQAFVAMMFSSRTNKLWANGISKGIADAGYKPFRIDKLDHNNRIDDEIIAAIRKSKFLVADFTGNRGGVYFEAGFALGLGQQVIWLCRKDELDKVHFDTRQYNHITWEIDKLPELARALTLRIEATIGRGEFGNEI
jgi:nucleoside 2-deoxyribosyltransferase